METHGLSDVWPRVLCTWLACAAFACADDAADATPDAGDGDAGDGDGDGDGDQPQDPTGVSWELENFKQLGDDYTYEAWLIVDGADVSLGRFGVSLAGAPEIDRADLTPEMIAGAEALLVSIEDAQDDDPARGDRTVLGGDLVDGAASLSTGHAQALGEDFMDIHGSFVLATPTSDDEADVGKGVWWYDPETDTPSLELPAAPEGWVYEGWVTNAQGSRSTGRFTAVDGADSDGAGPAAGALPAPAFPGQEFIDEVDWMAGAVAVTVEMEPDNSPAPNNFRILLSAVRDGSGTLQRMDLDAVFSAPWGTAALD